MNRATLLASLVFAGLAAWLLVSCQTAIPAVRTARAQTAVAGAQQSENATVAAVVSDVNAGPLVTALAQAKALEGTAEAATPIAGLHLNGAWTGTGTSSGTVITLTLTVENGDEITAAERSYEGTGGAPCVLAGTAAGAAKVAWLPVKIVSGQFLIPQLGVSGEFGTSTTAAGDFQFTQIDAAHPGCNGTFVAQWTAGKK